MKINGKAVSFDADAFLRHIGPATRMQSCVQKQIIFSQANTASSLFYICKGRVRLTVFSSEGRAATIAILGKGDFLGEECLAMEQPLRLATAVAITDCSFVQIEKQTMLGALDSDRALAGFFMEHLLKCKIRAHEDLADHLSHSSEKRLVRLLLLLAGPHSGDNGATKRNYPEISQETLAEMVGTTRPRISYFMNKFRKMGLVDYSSGLHVSKELENLLQ
jgi:CRP/FNR family cyclic AMP-dependent transcriptional regulator